MNLHPVASDFNGFCNEFPDDASLEVEKLREKNATLEKDREDLVSTTAELTKKVALLQNSTSEKHLFFRFLFVL